MNSLAHLMNVDRKLSVFKVVAPQDGGWSLTPMENLLRGLRGEKDVFSFEIFGRDGVVAYRVRTNNADGLGGMFHSYFPQARLDAKVREPGDEPDVDDWMYMDEDEFAMVVPLYLKRPSYLPLRIYDDRTIEQSTMDPLAGVIGVLSMATRQVGPSAGGDRLGMRLVVRAAREDWGNPWQKKMQQRRDGEDRAARPGSPESQGPSLGTILGIAGVAAVGGANWWLWDQGNLGGLVGFDAFAALAGVGGLVGWRRHNAANARRPFLDEELVDSKLKSLGFLIELQLVRIYRSAADEAIAQDSLLQLTECLRSFDDPAGNSWIPGRVRSYSGQRIFQGNHVHPFVGGSQEMTWLEPERAKDTVLSARETASLWHPPLGADEMASMERTAAGILVPFLADLSQEGADSGPLVGLAGGDDMEIYLPESSLRKHALIIGKSGVGKSTVIKHVLAHKLQRKAAGLDNGAIVVIDPHADLVRDTLKLVPESIADKVRLLDFGRMDRVPGINLVDPYLFPDRDRCVDTIVGTVRHLWEHWGGRLEDLLKRSLSIIYEFNSNPITKRDEMLTMLDILLLLDDGVTVGSGPNARTEPSNFQKRVLSRVTDPRLKQWFTAYLGWGRETRSEAVGPVHSRIGAYAADARASVIMGQRESTIMLSDVLTEGLVLLVSTAQGTIGVQPAALMGGTMVSLVEAAMRDQEKIEQSKRARCLLVCDEFQTVSGANWEGMLAEIRKYGGSLLLATQSVARLDTPDRKLKAGLLGNIGVILAYQMAAEDAHIIAPEMDAERVQDRFLVNADPHHCYARITSDTKVYPAFSMKTLPPPDLAYGSDRSVQAVLDASIAYTVDWQEARTRMNEEVDRQISMAGKVGDEPEPFNALGAGDGGAATATAERVLSGSILSGKPPGEAFGLPDDGPVVTEGVINRLEGLLSERRSQRSRVPGAAYDEAKAAGDIPAGAGTSQEGDAVVEDMVMTGAFRGFRKSDLERSNIGEKTRRILIDLSNQDTFMKALLDRRLNSRLGSERIRVREEEVDKVEGRVRQRVADEVRGEVEVQVREELKPDLDRVEEERSRIRDEERADLQRQYDELDRSRKAMEDERLLVREEEMARARVEFAMSVAAEAVVEATVGDTPVVDVRPVGLDPVVPLVAAGGVSPGGIEPQAGGFDMDAFLVDRGYEAPAAAVTEGNGVVVVEPMAVLEAGDVAAPVPEPEGVQDNPRVVGGDFDDGGFGSMDVEQAMEPGGAGGEDLGSGAVIDGADRPAPAGAVEPVAVEPSGVGDAGQGLLSDEVNQILELVGGVVEVGLPGTGAVVLEEGGGETLELGEVLHSLGEDHPLDVRLYEEGGERPVRFGRRRK